MRSDHAPTDPHHAEPDSRAEGEGASHPEVARARLLEAVLEPVIETMGFSLVHLEWIPGGSRAVLRVFVDRPEGVTLDHCARLSPIIGNALDAAEVEAPGTPLARLLAGPYVLEVSSPGLDRPLSRRREFGKFIGQRATVRTFAPLSPEDRQRTFHGRIQAVEADPDAPDDDRRGVVVLVEDDTDRVHRIALSQIRRANLNSVGVSEGT
jgi:ribosome maturation factor RimP